MIADTNVLLRAIVRDDPHQGPIARKALADARIVAVSTSALCEAAWVLTKRYKHKPAAAAAAIRGLVNAANVVTDRQVVDAGLAMLDAGGDFADGVIAFEGRALGGREFVSFDKEAVTLVRQQGESARLLA
ncbi:MAG: type II toxin-antitoxin system VapC family toxin [Vitreimonas sp.]